MVLTQPVRELDALGRVGRRHADVEDDRVDVVIAEEHLQLEAVGSRGDHLQVGVGVEDGTGPLAHEIVVLGDQQAGRHAHLFSTGDVQRRRMDQAYGDVVPPGGGSSVRWTTSWWCYHHRSKSGDRTVGWLGVVWDSCLGARAALRRRRVHGTASGGVRSRLHPATRGP
jgi:hypothetical protein